jgi:hypothetical protein
LPFGVGASDFAGRWVDGDGALRQGDIGYIGRADNGGAGGFEENEGSTGV